MFSFIIHCTWLVIVSWQHCHSGNSNIAHPQRTYVFQLERTLWLVASAILHHLKNSWHLASCSGQVVSESSIIVSCRVSHATLFGCEWMKPTVREINVMFKFMLNLCSWKSDPKSTRAGCKTRQNHEVITDRTPGHQESFRQWVIFPIWWK